MQSVQPVPWDSRQIKDFNFPDLGITDAFDIKQNVRGIAQYLSKMLELWHNNPKQLECALASYFKGYTGFKRDEGCMDSKTAGYVGNIIAKYQEIVQLKQNMKIS